MRRDGMCGIAGALVPTKDALIYVHQIQEDTEYRGYDSNGDARIDSEGKLVIRKFLEGPSAAGMPEAVETEIAIGHNRWASQGEITVENAHPHTGCDQNGWTGVHNGVVENYDRLFDMMTEQGHTIRSQTDSEIIFHLIEHMQRMYPNLSSEEIVAVTLREVEGTFGLVLLNPAERRKLIVARRGSPVHIAFLENGGYLVASDKAALLRHTSECVSLEDNEIGVLSLDDGHQFFDLGLNILPPKIPQHIYGTVEEQRKDGYPDFTLKEICVIPAAVRRAIAGRLLPGEGTAKLGGIRDFWPRIRKAKRIVIIGCGTSEHAGLMGQMYLHTLAKMPTVVVDASEFLYSDFPLFKSDVVIFISQSGETGDVLKAIEKVKGKVALTIGIVNKVGSYVAQQVDCGSYIHAGPEIGVASTKAFIAQTCVLLLFALELGRLRRKVNKKEGKRIVQALLNLPDQIQQIIDRREEIRSLVETYVSGFSSFLFFGRQGSAVVSMEAALKLEEVSYINTQGIPAGKMKHGPLALIDDVQKGGFPCCFIAPHFTAKVEDDVVFMKTLINIKEVKTRHGKILALATEGNILIRKSVDDVFYMPQTHPLTAGAVSAVAAFFMAYFGAILAGFNPDQPRNLAKSVTIE